jgi:hypothetical protein
VLEDVEMTRGVKSTFDSYNKSLRRVKRRLGPAFYQGHRENSEEGNNEKYLDQKPSCRRAWGRTTVTN